MFMMSKILFMTTIYMMTFMSAMFMIALMTLMLVVSMMVTMTLMFMMSLMTVKILRLRIARSTVVCDLQNFFVAPEDFSAQKGR
jgi:hypothetical protein